MLNQAIKAAAPFLRDHRDACSRPRRRDDRRNRRGLAREPGGYLIAADAGLGSVPLEVRVTRRWREMDSNFRGARDKGSVRRFHFAPELIATDGSSR